MRNNPAYATWAARGGARKDECPPPVPREEGGKSKAVGGSKKGHSFVYPGGEEGGRKAMASERDRAQKSLSSLSVAQERLDK